MRDAPGRSISLILFAATLIAAGCSQQELRSFEGVADGEYVAVAASLSGSLASLKVKRGTRVKEGEPLFALNAQTEWAARGAAEARAKLAQANLLAARRSATRETILAAEGAFNAAQAELAEAQWRLDQKMAKAPQEGVVVDTLYTEGQWVPGGAAVVSIISPDALKVRFYVPAHIVGTLRHAQGVRLKCLGCEDGMRAQITYISPIAALSDGVAGRMDESQPRFLVEAKPRSDAVIALRPGSPVVVLL